MNKTTLNSQKEKHSLLSLRRATFVGLAAHRLRNISIHALLAESDTSQPHCAGSFAISIHALLAESDPIISSATSCRWLFLSTLSLRRATAAEHRLLALNSISIHALLAESDLIHITQYSMCKISIHALLAESDILGNPCAGCPAISIHALLAESDGCRIEHDAAVAYDFYPRSPCGERLPQRKKRSEQHEFLSTLSLRRATTYEDMWLPDDDISIHALLAESDR